MDQFPVANRQIQSVTAITSFSESLTVFTVPLHMPQPFFDLLKRSEGLCISA